MVKNASDVPAAVHAVRTVKDEKLLHGVFWDAVFFFRVNLHYQQLCIIMYSYFIAHVRFFSTGGYYAY